MEDFSGNMDKTLKKASLPNQNRRNKRWQLLLVDNHGRMISVDRFKGVAIALFVGLMTAVLAVVILLYLYQNSLEEKASLNKALANTKKEVKNLRQQTEIQMARLVLNGNRSDTTPPKAAEKVASTKEKKSKKETRPASPPHVEEKKKPEKATASNEPDKKKPPPGDTVKVEKFTIKHDADRKILRIRFIIRNTDDGPGTISGYIFVLLKPDNADPRSWLSIPSVNLVNGRPDYIGRGQYFKISRFKTVHFKVNNQETPQQYRKATVFIFNTDGDKLLKETIPIAIEGPPGSVEDAADGETGADMEGE